MLGAVLRDDVCLVIDMECFCVDGVYRCRELGFCSWRGDCGRVAVTPVKRRCHLTAREKQQVTSREKFMDCPTRQTGENFKPTLFAITFKSYMSNSPRINGAALPSREDTSKRTYSSPQTFPIWI